MAHTVQPLPFSNELDGISKKTVEIHHDKLYAGYVAKRNEVEEAIVQADATKANQIYSAYRGLKEGETFAANGMILHQVHFANLGGNGDPAGTKVHDAIVSTWGSWEAFVAALSATAMAARGWAILAFDPSDAKLHLFAADAQNQGGVWGCTPLLCLDVYEHAYFIDVGSDRPTYIKNFLKNINWQDVDARYAKVSQ